MRNHEYRWDAVEDDSEIVNYVREDACVFLARHRKLATGRRRFRRRDEIERGFRSGPGPLCAKYRDGQQ